MPLKDDLAYLDSLDMYTGRARKTEQSDEPQDAQFHRVRQRKSLGGKSSKWGASKREKRFQKLRRKM